MTGFPCSASARELNEKQWRAVIRQLVAMGHLQPDAEAFGALKLTETARGVLERRNRGDAARGSRRHPRARPAGPNPGAAILLRRPAGPAKAGDPSLIGALRAWRSEVARQRGVPAYVVLHDSTIDGIAASRPTTPGQLRDIPGIGDKKLEHYGDELIALVKNSGA